MTRLSFIYTYTFEGWLYVRRYDVLFSTVLGDKIVRVGTTRIISETRIEKNTNKITYSVEKKIRIFSLKTRGQYCTEGEAITPLASLLATYASVAIFCIIWINRRVAYTVFILAHSA